MSPEDIERKLHQELSIGQQAQDCINNEFYKGTWQTLKEQFVSALKNLNPRDIEGLKECRHALVILDKIEQTIQDAAETGKMARYQLERRQQTLGEAVSEWRNSDPWITRDGSTV
jgi:hypothetical protein